VTSSLLSQSGFYFLTCEVPVILRRLLWPIVLCAALAATNRYAGPPLTRDFNPGDAFFYYAIAEAAPALADETLYFHHAQRLAAPYVVGLLHRAAPIPLHDVFRAAVLLLMLAILLVSQSVLEQLALHRRQAGVILGALALNPWVFRPYLTFPEMIPDLAFVLGTALMLRGLAAGRGRDVLIGQLVASLGRQTGLLLVPMAAAWIWRDREVWGRIAARRRAGYAIASAGLAGSVYLATGAVAASFSFPSDNAEHLYGMVLWLATMFDPAVLAEFLTRAALPPLLGTGLILGLGRRAWLAGRASDLAPVLAFGSLCIWAQPILGGPEITGPTVIRLVAIGVLPLLVLLGTALHASGAFAAAASGPRLAGVWALVAIGSLHHAYVFTGYVLASAGCAAIAAREVRR